ncbi:amidohydrolase family protein [Elongatibacter sediminis]|uniref:Amidohydrolase family protein n=1 Tax=Elongatibacter sediminis TaxID=3119006 RepID=A0AAW9RDJ5_9GAMM
MTGTGRQAFFSRRPSTASPATVLPMCLVLVCLALVLPAHAADGASGDESITLVLAGGRLIDGFGGAPVENAGVLIAGERIAAAGPLHSLKVPDGVRTIDTNGMTMLPGLWESHGHLFHVGEADPGAFQQRFADRLPIIMQAVARVSVEAGITAYRDFCTSCAAMAKGWRSPLHEAQLELKRQILAGEMPGPRLYLSGPILGQAASDGGRGNHFKVATRAEARRAVRELVDMAVDNVFVGANIWDVELLRSIVEASHAAGLGVDAESRHVRATTALLEAGADRIHVLFTADALAGNSDEELRALIRGHRPTASGPSANILRGPWYLSTLPMRQAYVDAGQFPEILDHPRFRELLPADIHADLRANWANYSAIPWGIGAGERVEVARRKLERFIEAGGREQLIAATDVGAPLNFHTPIPRQLRNFVEAGLTPMEAIQSATLRPAQMQGVDRQLGTVSAGKFADIIVVDGDPLQDITVLEHRLVRVVMNGRVVK